MGKIERIQVPSVDRERLEQLIRDRNSPQKVVWRARIVLSAGDGLGAVAIAAAVGDNVFRRMPVTADMILMALETGHVAHEPLTANI